MPFSELFIVEYDNGEMVDATGDGGYSVWDTRAEAQDALDSEASSVDDPSIELKIVRFVREESTDAR